MRRLYLSALAAEKPSFLAKENDHDADLAKNLGKIQEISDAIRQNNPRQAIAVYDALPQSIKGEKVPLLARLMAAQSLDDDAEYRKAMDDFRRYFPEDPCLDLINIDHYFLTKQFDKELAAIDHIETVVGGDPYLNVLRANVYFAQGKIDPGAAICPQGFRGGERPESRLPDGAYHRDHGKEVYRCSAIVVDPRAGLSRSR